jgi:hypothetical protein
MALVYTNNLVPKMVDYRLPEGEVIYSSISGSGFAWKAFDKDEVNYGWFAGSKANEYVGYKFKEPVAINKYTILCTYDLTSTPKDFRFEASNDLINWTVLDQRTGISNWTPGVKKEFILPQINSVEYMYYRLFITSNNGHTAYIVIAEIEMMGLDIVPAQITFTNPNMIVPQNTNANIEFTITKPSGGANITEINDMTPISTSTGSAFSTVINKDNWQKINSIEVLF